VYVGVPNIFGRDEATDTTLQIQTLDHNLSTQMMMMMMMMMGRRRWRRLRSDGWSPNGEYYKF